MIMIPNGSTHFSLWSMSDTVLMDILTTSVTFFSKHQHTKGNPKAVSRFTVTQAFTSSTLNITPHTQAYMAGLRTPMTYMPSESSQ
jgi:hypothetical protein